MFGTEVGNVKRTRSFNGENTSALAKSAGTVEADDSPLSSVTVTATLHPDGYTLLVEAQSQSTTIKAVDPDDLSDTIAHAISAVTKAVLTGQMSKSQRPYNPLGLGMGMPTPNRRNLRFA